MLRLVFVTALIAAGAASSTSSPSPLVVPTWRDETVQDHVVLVPPRIFSATLKYNNSIYLLGGCTEPSCTNMGTAVTQYTQQEQRDGSVVSQLHQHASPRLGVIVDFSGYFSVGFSGATSAVTVGLFDGFENGLGVGFKESVWVVGACGLHFSNTLSSVEMQKFNTLWKLDEKLEKVERKAFINQVLNNTEPPKIPLRVNATCVAYGPLIYIIGGVVMTGHHKQGYLQLTSSVDIFDTRTSQYTPFFGDIGRPVMNVAAVVDDHYIYAGGGQTCDYYLLGCFDLALAARGHADGNEDVMLEEDTMEASQTSLSPSPSSSSASTTAAPKLPQTKPSGYFRVMAAPCIWECLHIHDPQFAWQKVDGPEFTPVGGGSVTLLPFAGVIVLVQDESNYLTLPFDQHGEGDEGKAIHLKDLHWESHKLIPRPTQPSPAATFIATIVQAEQETRVKLHAFGGLSSGLLSSSVYSVLVPSRIASLPGLKGMLPSSLLSMHPLRTVFYSSEKGHHHHGALSPSGESGSSGTGSEHPTGSGDEPTSYFLRLSIDGACHSEDGWIGGDFTLDQELNQTVGPAGTLENTFITHGASPKTYLCLGTYHNISGLVPKGSAFQKKLFVALNWFKPFAVVPWVPPVPTFTWPPTPPTPPPTTVPEGSEVPSSISGSTPGLSGSSHGRHGDNNSNANAGPSGPMSKPGPIIGLVLGVGLSVMGLIVLYLRWKTKKDTAEKEQEKMLVEDETSRLVNP